MTTPRNIKDIPYDRLECRIYQHRLIDLGGGETEWQDIGDVVWKAEYRRLGTAINAVHTKVKRWNNAHGHRAYFVGQVDGVARSLGYGMDPVFYGTVNSHGEWEFVSADDPMMLLVVNQLAAIK